MSNDDDGEQLNIWLKASFIHDVLKCLVQDDPDSLPLFNGFEDVIRNAELGELRLKPYRDNACRANKKGNFTYKDFFNYYMIPKEMGPYKATIEKFKNTMVKETIYEPIITPSINTCGFAINNGVSLQVPGSDSSALTTK